MEIEESAREEEEEESYSSGEDSNSQEEKREEDEDDYILSEGETEESFSKLVVLRTLEVSDLDFYNEQEYIKYVLNDLNEIRKKYKIPERDLNKKFSLFREKDFLEEYKTLFYNNQQKQLLDQKYLVACDFLRRNIPTQENDFVQFERDPIEIAMELREKIEEQKKINKIDISSIFSKPEHLYHYFKTKKIRISNEVRRKKKIAKKPRILDERIHANFVKELVKQNNEKGKKTTVREIVIEIKKNFSSSLI